MNSHKGVAINRMNLPGDLKALSIEQCEEVACQIRRLILNTVSKNGGHLSSNLGTVELAVALHKVFNSPKDKLIWDVGHQAYAHKILTSRLDRMKTLRKKDGLSGFLRPEESEHDAVVSGHSSTSISSALGIAHVMKQKGDPHHAIAIIGDGAFTGGLAYEALNNAGKSETNLIVILNYNEMSISKSNGAIAKYLSGLRISDGYLKTKGAMEKILDNTILIGKPIKNTLKKSKNMFKSAILHSTMFENFGFEYLGPCDGHNMEDLVATLKVAKNEKKPVFIMVQTKKGKGYHHAEENPGEYHGIGSFSLKSGERDEMQKDTFSDIFGKKLCALAEDNPKINAVTAAMKYGTGLQYFAKKFPNRFFDVGIAEEHAVTFCGGLAAGGAIPVFAVYSTFLQRSYDQIIHDLSIGGFHAVLAVDRAGIVGEDGETHNGTFDVAFLSTIPNVTLFAPFSAKELELCLEKTVDECTGIACVRYPRGCPSEYEGFANALDYEFIPDKKGGCDNLIVTYGRISGNAASAAVELAKDGIDCAVLRLVKIIPISEKAIEICSMAKNIFFFEESSENGSVSQQIACKLLSRGYAPKIDITAINGFVKQQTVNQALEELGLDMDGMIRKVKGNICQDLMCL